MKKSIFLTLALTLVSAQAFARTPEAAIECKGTSDRLGTVIVKAGLFAVSERGRGSMFDAKVTFVGVGESKAESGRAQSIESLAKYNPRKYKNHVKFDMSKLIDTKDFGSYLPGDTCVINVMIPVDAASRPGFDAPVVINCDQSGGSMTLSCTSIARR